MTEPEMQDWMQGVRDSVDLAIRERLNQINKWGPQSHDLAFWHLILLEEVGELAQSKLNFITSGASREDAGGMDLVKKEAVQVAAVALAIVQFCEKGKA